MLALLAKHPARRPLGRVPRDLRPGPQYRWVVVRFV